ncbi:MAG: hypothetical protein EYC62_06000 [Alphaproteobacteria bacterium]|nr:MAG: hypothetical protein EYC62_06000 [Alphaproteobacteria bacterium]
MVAIAIKAVTSFEQKGADGPDVVNVEVSFGTQDGKIVGVQVCECNTTFQRVAGLEGLADRRNTAAEGVLEGGSLTITGAVMQLDPTLEQRLAMALRNGEQVSALLVAINDALRRQQLQ